MLNWLKNLFVKEVIVEKVKFVGTTINCPALLCIENVKGVCTISNLSLQCCEILESGDPTFACDEYCKHDTELINDVNKLIIQGK